MDVKTKLAKKLVELLRVKDLSRDDISTILYNISSSLDDEMLLSDLDIENEIDFFYENFLSIKDRLSTIYSNYYSENELLDMINFYSSVTGQKVLDNQNKIMNEMMSITESLGSEIYETIKKKFL